MANPPLHNDPPVPVLADPAPGEFRLRVSAIEGKPELFAFDQPRVTVGRALDCDLRIEHAGISRHQFTIERSLNAGGEPRFRIIPADPITNPVLVNRVPAVEGALRPGDVIAVGELRIVLEYKAGKLETKRSLLKLSPFHLVLVVATLFVAGLTVYSLVGDGSGEADLTTAQIPLFGPFRPPHCSNPIECDSKAHEAYERGRKYYSAASVDPGNLYRAALEFARARSYREQSGRPLGDIADVDARAENARRDAEAAFEDARFALKRAIASGNLRRCAIEAELLARMVPDDTHPYRLKLDDYRRSLPQSRRPGGGTSEAAP